MRAVNRLIAAVFALAVAGAGLLTAAEVLVARTGWPHDPPLVVPYDRWLRTLRPHGWADTVVLLSCVGVAVLGVLLILAALVGREKRIRLSSEDPDLDMSTSPRSLSRALRNDARSVDGVGTASARVRQRKAKVTAEVRLGEPTAVEQELETTLSERLRTLSLATPPKLVVRVSAAKGRR